MGLFEIIKTANHNLFRNKVRTFLTILAIFVGSFTIVLNVAINTGVNSFIDEQTASLGGEDYIMIMAEGSVSTLSTMMGAGNSEPQEYDPNQTMTAFTNEQLEKLKNIDGIDGDTIYAVKQAPVEYITSDKTDKKYTISVGAMPPGDFSIASTAGGLPDNDSDEAQIMLEPGYAEALGFGSDENAIGKTVTLTVLDNVTKQPTSFKAKVVGVQAKGVVAVNGSVISRKLEDDMVEAIYATMLKTQSRDQLFKPYAVQARFDTDKYTEQEIKDHLQENGFYGVTVSDMMGTIRTFFDVIMIVFTIFGGIALLAASIGIVNTLLMSVEERTREIGLDKALGMSSGKIFLEFAVEAIALGFWGSALGVAVAMIIGNIVNVAVHASGGFLEAFPTFNLFEFTPSNVVPIILVVMVIALLAGTAPAWKAAHKNPIDALRYE